MNAWVLRLLVAGGSFCLCGQQAAASPKYRTWLDRANAAESTARLTNPYAGQADAVKAGEKLFERYCSACHGTDARGRGSRPALHSPTVKSAPPGALYWLLRNGNLKKGMPSWSALPPEQLWQLVTWIQAVAGSR